MNRGGIETLLINLYRNIDRSKIQFDFLLSSKKEGAYNNEILRLGGKIYYLPSRREGAMKNKKALNDFFLDHPEYKIVHQHVSSLTYVEPLKAAMRHGVPIRIIHSHNTKQAGMKIHFFLHHINKLNVKKYATNYFACSKSAAKWLYPKYIFKRQKYKIIDNAIDLKNFVFDLEIRNKIRSKFGFSEDLTIIGHVGRFNLQKNHVFIIDVFNKYLKLNPKSKLVLVGDGPLRSEILNKVTKLGIQDFVVFTGVISYINEILQAFDIFIMPSLYEGFPVTLVEAQTSGLQCIVSNTITSEVDFSGLIKWENLNSKSEVWANKIHKFENYNRGNLVGKIKNSDYDILTVSKELQDLYLSFLNEKSEG
jgi:glycosyltransferase involved in cell wall biosynthesis